MKKQYALIFTLICLLSLKSSAQESIIGDINYGTLEKYIQAARAYYPKRKITEAQKDIAKVGVTQATLSYLDIFSASYFYRPNGSAASSSSTAVLPGQTGNTNIIIGNGIQYGISVNLGSFLSKPFAVKRAKSELKVAKLQVEDYDIALVSEVRKTYYMYIQSLSELKIRTQTAQENRVVADNAAKRFAKGEVNIEEYNNSRRLLADANSSQIATEVAYLNAKDDLEALIGKKLTDIK